MSKQSNQVYRNTSNRYVPKEQMAIYGYDVNEPTVDNTPKILTGLSEKVNNIQFMIYTPGDGIFQINESGVYNIHVSLGWEADPNGARQLHIVIPGSPVVGDYVGSDVRNAVTQMSTVTVQTADLNYKVDAPVQFYIQCQTLGAGANVDIRGDTGTPYNTNIVITKIA